jgi:hypothetical protein
VTDETERRVEALVVALDKALEALDLRDEWPVVSLHESERLFHGAWIPQEGTLLRGRPEILVESEGMGSFSPSIDP